MFTRRSLYLPEVSPGTGVEGRLEALERQYKSLLDALVSDRLALNQPGAIDIADAVINATNGIVFPATQNASTDANTLDDYEETPSWTPAGNGVTFSSAAGQANKIGRFFIAHFDVTWPATVDAGEARITGLPYTVANSGPAMGGFISYTDYGSADVMVRGFANATYGLLNNHSGATLTNAQVSGKRFIGAVISFV